MSDHFGEFKPLKPQRTSGGFPVQGFFGNSPARSFSISNTVLTCTVDENNSSFAPVRLTLAPTPRASPALRVIGCWIEPLYWTHANHGAFQIRGKWTGAELPT